MNRHHVTNHLLTVDGERLFTDAGWQRVVSPKIDAMPATGGLICIFLSAQPMRQNFLDVQVATFDPDERTAIRKAILNLRKKRAKSHDATN